MFEGIGKPFSIGLSAIEEADWLEFCDNDQAVLREKARLLETRLADVFVSEEGTEDSQREVLDLIFAALQRHDSERAGRTFGDCPALVKAAHLVGEDLVLMRRDEKPGNEKHRNEKGGDEHGWRLVAGVVCFPSNWHLREKFGLPIGDIHDPVPGFETASRNDTMINRIFDRMAAGPIVERFNWSLVGDGGLAQFPQNFQKLSVEALQGLQVFLRVERQTLRKLPKSGDILFTIRIHVDRLCNRPTQTDNAKMGEILAKGLKEMNKAQLNYKGYCEVREVLLARLAEMGNVSCGESGTKPQAAK